MKKAGKRTLKRTGKYVILGVILLGILLLLPSNTHNPDLYTSPPEVVITVNGQVVDYMCGINEWNGIMVDRIPTVRSLINNKPDREIPYIPLGGNITIAFKGDPPLTFMLYDWIADVWRDPKSGASGINSRYTQTEFKDGIVSFEFAPHPGCFPVSNPENQWNGNVYRAFLLVCAWDDEFWGRQECDYGFIVKTGVGEKSPADRIDLDLAKKLIAEHDLHNEFKVMEKELIEITSTEIWDKTGCQLFKIVSGPRRETFVIINRQVARIGDSYEGDYGVTSAVPFDIDEDGVIDIVYAYSNAGRHSFIGYFSFRSVHGFDLGAEKFVDEYDRWSREEALILRIEDDLTVAAYRIMDGTEFDPDCLWRYPTEEDIKKMTLVKEGTINWGAYLIK